VEIQLHAFLTLGMVKVSGQLHAPAASPRGIEPRCRFDRRLGELQSRSERGGGKKKSLPSAGNRTVVVQPVA
jgi:hypothetical protein